MRCFFAIPLSDEVKDYLYDFMNDLKKELKKHNLKIRFIPKKNLHITLSFLGDLSESKLNKVKDEVRKVEFNSFKFKLDKIGVFPDEERVRVIWLGVKPEKMIVDLLRKVDEKLLGIINNDADFKVHITLAKMRPSKSSSKIVPDIKKVEVKKIEQKVDSFGLYESRVHKDGSKYFLIEEFKAKRK